VEGSSLLRPERFKGLGLDFDLFLMDNTQLNKSSLPSFYKSILVPGTW